MVHVTPNDEHDKLIQDKALSFIQQKGKLKITERLLITSQDFHLTFSWLKERSYHEQFMK